MKLLLHLYKFWWVYLIVAGAFIGAGLYIHHSIYESGFAASEAKWKPLFAAAKHELAEANARTKAKETESNLAVAESQRRIDETRKNLDTRLADADKHIRALSMRLAAATTSSREMPPASGATAEPDAASESIQRASEAGGLIASTGADCEADAAALAEWQRFYPELRRIINQ